MSHLGTSESLLGGRLSPDDRYELASRAQSQQRLNYPKHLIVLGAFLVIISLVVLFVAWRSLSAAQKTHERKAYQLTQIQEIIGNINTLEQSQANNTGLDQFQPINDILSKFKQYARQAKLSKELGLPKQPKSRNMGNAKLLTYPYAVRDPSLEHLLNWVKISTNQIPGLEVTDMTIKPGKQDWLLTITFSRYERVE